jgi:hypothetical protein
MSKLFDPGPLMTDLDRYEATFHRIDVVSLMKLSNDAQGRFMDLIELAVARGAALTPEELAGVYDAPPPVVFY